MMKLLRDKGRLDRRLGTGASPSDAKAQPPHLIPVAKGPGAWIDAPAQYHSGWKRSAGRTAYLQIIYHAAQMGGPVGAS